MTPTRRSRRGTPVARARLELARDGLLMARRAAPGDEEAARREIRRARAELRKVLRVIGPHRELAPLLAPVMSLILELGDLLTPRD